MERRCTKEELMYIFIHSSNALLANHFLKSYNIFIKKETNIRESSIKNRL